VEVNKFSDTKVGMFVMVLIGWNYIGHDLLQAAIGVPLLFIGTIYFMFVFYRNCVVRRVLLKTGGKGEKEWVVVNTSKDYVSDGRTGTSSMLAYARWNHAAAYFVFVGICAIIILVRNLS